MPFLANDELEKYGTKFLRSNGVHIPAERSIKQRQFAYCTNPECRENGAEYHWEIKHDWTCCPKCGANQAPMVGILAKIHLMVRDKTGPLQGNGGLRYRLACDTKKNREGISTLTNYEVATDQKEVCNCQDCLIEAMKLNVGPRSGIAIA
jgi:hypothetical protein